MTPQVLAGGFTFPEGPRWRDGKLWLSDFYAHRVVTVDLAGKVEEVVKVPQQPSGLGFLPDGRLLIVSMLDRKLLRLDGGALTEVADLSAHATGPCNDMVVDAKGRAYVGNFGSNHHAGEAPRNAALVRVDPDGKITKVADDLEFPNGTVITPDGKTLIVGETRGNRLTAFDIAADGGLSNRRVFAAIDGMFPDGICLDAAGGIWVADPRALRTLRVEEGGRVTHSIDTSPRGCYACMLGGDDGRTLFILTNSGSGPAMGQKADGRIETVRVDVPHAGLP
ncbi:SMP-30/gluconolactonase/LRE family protein [Desertibaculum subflavum]|uniref:SMP-30/gluconolactonase/LRE family protein n=1 Tax=Desertibaculum subflavum TaxID=2268458 RepID=UPI000E669C38